MIKHVCSQWAAMKRLFSFLACLLFSLQIQARPTIDWVSPEWPPFYINSGPQKDLGLSQAYQFFFRQQLNEYQHETALMNFSRFIKEVQHEKELCMADLLKKPAREKVLYYSDTMTLSTPQQLIMLERKAETLLGDKQTVSLAEILKNPDLNTIFVAGRSYSVLDPVIQSHLSLPNVEVGPITNSSLLSMLQRGRIDYFIEYPVALGHISKELSKKTDIRIISIEEQVPFIKSYVTCTRTPEGKRIIDKINTIIREQKTSEGYKSAFFSINEYLDPQSIEKQKELYQTFIELN